MGIVDIDERAVELSEVEAARLAGRRYRVVRTPSQLLVGFEAPERVSEERLILAGDLAQVAFPEIVSLVAPRARHRRTFGRWVRPPRAPSPSPTARSAGATSSRAGERLGDVMVRMGQLSRAQLDALLEETGEVRPAGRLAVELAACSANATCGARCRSTSPSVFQAILLESAGTFVLTDERVRDTNDPARALGRGSPDGRRAPCRRDAREPGCGSGREPRDRDRGLRERLPGHLRNGHRGGRERRPPRRRELHPGRRPHPDRALRRAGASARRGELPGDELSKAGRCARPGERRGTRAAAGGTASPR